MGPSMVFPLRCIFKRHIPLNGNLLLPTGPGLIIRCVLYHSPATSPLTIACHVLIETSKTIVGQAPPWEWRKQYAFYIAPPALKDDVASLHVENLGL